MKKPTVVITKASEWRAFSLSADHPEYSAISNLICSHSKDVDFVLAGTSGSSLQGSCVCNAVAWDLPVNGTAGTALYYLHLLRLFLTYRPRIVIVLGLATTIPAIVFSALSWGSFCVPVFIGEFEYHGRKTVGRLLNITQIKIMSLLLKVFQVRIPRAYALSEFLKREISGIAPELGKRIVLISYPIAREFYASPAKPKVFGLPTILTVAGIEPRKGLDDLIKAVALIPREDRPRLIIKGGVRDSDYMIRLTRLVESLGLSDKVEFHQQMIDYISLIRYYQSADVFVFPTRDDSLGVVCLEALHSGLPVVATEVGGVPDMVKNGVNGILVKPNDPVALADAIVRLLRDEKLRARFASNAVTALEEYYRRPALESALEKSLELL